MTLAESMAFNVMRQLGFLEPQRHPDWEVVVEIAQKRIDEHMEIMKELARNEGRIEVLQKGVDICDYSLSIFNFVLNSVCVFVICVGVAKIILWLIGR